MGDSDWFALKATFIATFVGTLVFCILMSFKEELVKMFGG